MYNKRFSKSLHDQNDAKGKQAAIEIMRDLAGAVLFEENTSEQAGDFSKGFWDVSFKLRENEKIIRVEPEIKASKWWGENFVSRTGKPFQYPDIDIPYRKHKCVADLHMVISSNLDLGFLVFRKKMDEVLARKGGRPKFKTTIFEPEGGYYFTIPVEEGRFVQKSNGKWRIRT